MGVSLPVFPRRNASQLMNCITRWYQRRFTSKDRISPVSVTQHTLLGWVEKIALETPERIFAIIPSHNSDLSQGWQQITFRQIVLAMHFICQWVENTVGNPEKGEYIAYSGGNDIRYAIFILACMKIGYIPLLLSPKISKDAYRHLMDAASCGNLVYSEERQFVKHRVEAAKPATKSWIIPKLSQIFDKSPSSHLSRVFLREREDDVVLALHSSGTTGLPKLVNLTNGYLQSVDHLLRIPKPPGRKLALRAAFNNGPSLCTTPFFHIMGLYSIFESIFHGLVFVLYPEGPVTEEGVLSVLSTSKPKSATFAPSILEELSKSNAFLEEIANLDVIFYGSASLSPDAGTRLTKYTDVVSLIGSTETAVISSLVPIDRENWNYFEWNPEYGVQMQPIGDGLHELIISRPTTREFHGVFHTYPDAPEYRTKDVFSPHPDQPWLWKAEARVDDVIVLSNGEKFNPINMEKAIERNPLVSHALVVGQDSFLPGVLLELHWDLTEENDSEDHLIGRIWQNVCDANKIAPDYAQISKSHILVASKDRPFVITSKGSIQREPTRKKYLADINRLLAKSEDITMLQKVDWSNREKVTFEINQIVTNLLSVRDLSDDCNLFSVGMNSLQVLRLTRMLKAAVQSFYDSEPKPDVRPGDIYAHPTIRQLESYIQSLRPDSGVYLTEAIDESSKNTSLVMKALVEKYTQNILPPSIRRLEPSLSRTVILTGSTGTVGNYLLYGLSQDPDISKIICLVRDAEAEVRQRKTLNEKGLALRIDSHVEYVVAQLDKPNLGLGLQKYHSLSRSVDIVIHNAWDVNFIKNLDCFGAHIEGVRRLCDFCLESQSNPRLHFISSIESVGRWSEIYDEPLPEDTVVDFGVAPDIGYSQSKFVAEHICDTIASRSNLSIGIHRVGQVGGPTTKLGHWNREEWLPSMIKTSKTIGIVPETLGPVDVNWIPVDTLATILLEIIKGHSKQYTENRATYFNLVNPAKTSWETLLPPLTRSYGVKPVGWTEWLDVLDRIQDPSEDDYAQMPALKILDFYKRLQSNSRKVGVSPSTKNGRHESQTMRSLEPITASLMELWIKQWSF